MENKKLKAYIVTDNYFLDEYVIVYAESNSKARSVAYQCIYSGTINTLI